jgi:hypothetical protein
MAGSSDFSRGNPRASGVDHPDIEDVARESPLTLRSQLSVQLTDCGDEQGTPCEELVLDIYNVMGQEDQFRHDGSERIQRGGIARVVVSTNENSDISIDYVGNPENEDSPTFEKTIQDASEEKKHHEFFFGVDPSSLYAFKINAEASDCPDIDEQSGIYYFNTGDTIQLEFERDLVPRPKLKVFESKVQKLVEYLVGDGYFRGTIDPQMIDGNTSSPSTKKFASTELKTFTREVSSFTTSLTTSIS